MPMRLLFGCLLAVVPSAWPQAAGALGEGDLILRSSSDLVVLSVGVQDRHGANIRGLKAADFRVYEDGRPQIIKQFADEERPVTIGIVVDASGSMRTKQAEVATAALFFARASNPQDEMFVVNFNDRAFLGLPSHLPFSNDLNLLRTALLGRRPEGKTALYDALALAANHLARGKWENKALLLVSDGGDNNSTHSFDNAIRGVEKSGAAVYSIGIYDPEDSEHNLTTLQRLSKMTGGEAFAPGDISLIGPLCVRIAADIRATYTLAYTPPEPDQHAASRKVKVVVAAPTGRRLVVRNRTSYVLPER